MLFLEHSVFSRQNTKYVNLRCNVHLMPNQHIMHDTTGEVRFKRLKLNPKI